MVRVSTAVVVMQVLVVVWEGVHVRVETSVGAAHRCTARREEVEGSFGVWREASGWQGAMQG